MIIDSHTHIFPEKIKQDRSEYFDNEPEFKLLYDSPKAKISNVDDLIESMDTYQVDISVICGFPWRNPEFTKQNNDVVIDAVQKHPDRIKGLACFDAAWDGAADETRRCIDAGLCGAGELAFYLSGVDKEALAFLDPVMAVLRDNGNLPCMIHTNEPIGHKYPGKTPITLEQIYTLAKTFPDNKIILAHWGGGILFYNIMKKETKDALKNIWYDTAASPFLYDSQIYDIAVDAGVADKVLFGTDFPLLTPDRYYTDIDNSNITPLQKEQILGKNAALLFRQ
ncbi:amidohydrolase family protein [Desulfobacula sp.]|uniref:amidohydrolase family protein n=1 Tax=Desulfobacula sp. TaxID=2593537 RepID=UPI0025C6B351|nr:amidohydrolase family protein [Desulfobacula sp.]MBC2705384.1 amidohydrolase [Desulfobacula sp.]MCK4768326.1 amidohydrolase [Desulfobacula sp.]